MPCDQLELSDEDREALIDYEHGSYPGCPLPFSPGLGDISPDDSEAWRMHQEANAITWESVWQLTSLELTAEEAWRLKERLVYIAAVEQQCIYEQREAHRER